MGTSWNLQLLASKDWYFSDLHFKERLRFHKNALPAPLQADYDQFQVSHGERLGRVLDTHEEPVDQIFTESELRYELRALNLEGLAESALRELHSKVSFTIKMLTYEMVEGKAPVLYLLDQ